MSWKDSYIAAHSEEEHERVKEKALERYYKNREQCQAKHREWNEKNPLKVLEGNRQRGRKGGNIIKNIYKMHKWEFGGNVIKLGVKIVEDGCNINA